MKTLALITLALSINTAMASDMMTDNNQGQHPAAYQHAPQPHHAVDHIHQRMMYVGANGMNIVDPATGQLVAETVQVGPSPQFSAFHPRTGHLYVFNRRGEVSVIDTKDGTVMDSDFSVGRFPSSAVFHPRTGLLYVANEDRQSISVFDPAKKDAVGQISLGNDPMRLVSMVIHPDTDTLYAVNTSEDNLLMIDTEKNAVVGDPISVGRSPRYAFLDPQNSYLYVVSNDIYRIDTQHNIVEGTLSSFSDELISSAVFYPGGPLYLVHEKNISVIDPVHNGFLYNIPINGSIKSAVLDSHTGCLYVLCKDGNTFVINKGSYPIAGEPIVGNDVRFSVITTLHERISNIKRAAHPQ